MPVSDHTAVLIEAVLSAVDGLVGAAGLLRAGSLEVEPTNLVGIPVGIARLLVLSVSNVAQSDLSPADAHSAVVLVAEVVLSLLVRVVIVIRDTVVLLNPAVLHLAVLIEAIGLAVDDSLEDGAGCVAVLVSLTVCLEVVPPNIRLVVFASALVIDSNPTVTNHCAVSVNVVVIVVVLDQAVGSHVASVVKVETVVAGVLPAVCNLLTCSVVVHPSSVLFLPAGSCERSHGCTDRKKRRCGNDCSNFGLLSHNKCTLLFTVVLKPLKSLIAYEEILPLFGAKINLQMPYSSSSLSYSAQYRPKFAKFPYLFSGYFLTEILQTFVCPYKLY